MTMILLTTAALLILAALPDEQNPGTEMAEKQREAMKHQNESFHFLRNI